MEIYTAIISGVIGLITGAVGSLIAPWVHWGIEKKRGKHERRAKLIEQWREIISSENFSNEQLLNHPLYGPLREQLSKEVIEQLERPDTSLMVSMTASTSPDRDVVMREVAIIEKKWGLI